MSEHSPTRSQPALYGVLLRSEGAPAPETTHFIASLLLGTFGLTIPQATEAVRRMERGEALLLGGWGRDIAETKAHHIQQRLSAARVRLQLEIAPMQAHPRQG